MQNIVSIIIPAYNESGTLSELVDKIMNIMNKENIVREIIIVDDGSHDETNFVINDVKKRYGDVIKAFNHKKNRGKSYAIKTGYDNSSGDIIIIIDADLQYDPEEIPKFINLIKNGYDVANGWRDFSKYPLLKKIYSRSYNFLVNRLMGTKVHDNNCGFKAFTREALSDVVFRKGIHRYLVPITHYNGFKVGEVKVHLYPRKSGVQKYGFNRLLIGLVDLIGLRLFLVFIETPMLLFGMTGMLALFLGMFIFLYFVIESYLEGGSFTFRPLIYISLFLIVAGIQFFSLGIMAESLSVLYNRLNVKDSEEEKT